MTMFDPDGYLNNLISNCRTAFGDRLLYVGLQGSYLRGEANEHSDIDVMMILDQFSVQDMDQYQEFEWCQRAFARVDKIGGISHES